jgi:putative hydrolase of the HAD superfamily
MLARGGGFAHLAAMQVNPAKAAAPDFRHVEAWIFDLDNTLYRADSDLFAQIDARMCDFVSRLLDVPPDEAKRIQKDYYRDHGTTLNGLIKRHNIDPETFLEFVHDIDLSVLAPDIALNEAIARLPGKRFVFTNGCRNYAQRVLERVGLRDSIDGLWDIRAIAFSPKPEMAAYRTVLAAVGIAPQRCAMFEDVARNLVPAHELGMTTVWLNNGSVWSKQGPEYPVAASHHIDYEIADLNEFLRSIRI